MTDKYDLQSFQKDAKNHRNPERKYRKIQFTNITEAIHLNYWYLMSQLTALMTWL